MKHLGHVDPLCGEGMNNKEENMDSVAATARSIDAVNNVMESANKATLKAAEKIMKVTVQTAVGAETGKGGAVDLSS